MNTSLVFLVLLLLALLALVYGMEWLFVALFVLVLALVLARFGAREAPEEPAFTEPVQPLEKEGVVVVQQGAQANDFVTQLVNDLVKDAAISPREKKRHKELLKGTASLKQEMQELRELQEKKDKK